MKHAKRYAQEDILSNMCHSILVFYNRTSVIVALSWDSGETKLKTLLKVQSFAARIVTNIQFDIPAAALLHRLGWPTVDRLINRKLWTMVYESLIDLAHEKGDISKNLCYTHTRVLRNTRCNLAIQKMRTAYGY